MIKEKKLMVGITGGIGSGKSAASHFFEQLGIPCYYADKRAKWLMVNDKAVIDAITIHLGEQAYLDNGQLNKEFISKAIFNNRNKLKGLNEIVHPAVRKDAKSWHIEQKSAYTLQEAALFYENNSYQLMDLMICVFSPFPLRLQRTVLRDNSSAKAIKKRMDNQLSDWNKIQKADFVVYNDKDLKHLENQVLHVHEQIIKKQKT